MDIVEIILLAVGGIIFVLSFFIPDKKDTGTGNAKALAEDEIKNLISQEIEAIRSHVDDVVEEAVSYAMEKTERSLERLSNEKIMAVSEYSDTVLTEIHKNHEEAMFLYDMLNNKHTSLKNTVSEVNRTVKEAEETVTTFQKLAPETLVVESKIPVEQAPEQGAWYESIQKEPAAVSRMDASEQEQQWSSDNNNEKILELYGKGKSTVEIAKELELGVGEVKLVVDLFDKQNRGNK